MTEMDPADLLKTAGRYRLSQAIYAAAELGVADHLVDGPRTGVELARAIGADADKLRRLMRALASEGVFAEADDGGFGLAPAGRLLVSGAGAREMILGWSALPATYAAFGSLAASVRTGEPAFGLAHGKDFHAFLADDADASRAYDEANATTVDAFESGAASYDFDGLQTVVDVGGGTAGFLVAILRRHPGMRGINYDLPEVIAGINPSELPNDVRERLELVAGDFFTDQVPSGDAFILGTVLRLFDDDRGADLLRNIRRAMHPASKLLVMDFLHPAGPLTSPLGLADLQAMVVYGGRDRSEAEFAELFEKAGIRLTRVIETGDLHQWVEGMPA